jgi:hypothetical protein
MKLRKYLLPVAVIFVVITFFNCSYYPAEYFPLNQGDEWTYLHNMDGDEVEGKMFVNGTESVNGVDTVRMDVTAYETVLVRYLCYAIDTEGLKFCKHFFALANWYTIFDKPRMVFPSRFSLGEVYEEDYSYSRYSIEDDSLIFAATGSTIVSLESVEDVKVTAGIIFKDCLKIFTSRIEQRSDGWTLELEDASWYAPNVGLIKEETTQTVHHPVEEDSGRTDILELISATVDGITYE